MSGDKLRQLEGYGLFFGLVGKLLYAFPEREMLRSLADGDVFAELPVGSEDPRFARGADMLLEWGRAYRSSEDPASSFSDIRVDATRLFAGYQSIATPPWESVYFNKERMIFQEQTLDVRRWYRRHGLQLARKNREPDDHIGIEIDFISRLIMLALESDDGAGRDRLVDEAVRFTLEHPAAWVDRWAESVEAEARTAYYRGLALVSAAAVQDFAKAFSSAGFEGTLVL